jgi:hypothetical protein
MLLAILNKLNNMDVLYSLMNVNQKLDKLAQDATFTRSVDLVTITSNEHNNSKKKSILDRFCFDILPRIQHNIECLALDSLSVDRVLCIGSYPKLYKINLNLPLETARLIFNGMLSVPLIFKSRETNSIICCIYLDGSSFVHIFKHQISHLIVTINVNSTAKYIPKLSKNVVTTIFKMFMNLIYFHFHWNSDSLYKPGSLIVLPSTTYYSSSIVHLNVRVHNFNDCLCLLDGRLSQLHTFIVQVDHICDTSMIINNTVKYFKSHGNTFMSTFDRVLSHLCDKDFNIMIDGFRFRGRNGEDLLLPASPRPVFIFHPRPVSVSVLDINISFHYTSFL